MGDHIFNNRNNITTTTRSNTNSSNGGLNLMEVFSQVTDYHMQQVKAKATTTTALPPPPFSSSIGSDGFLCRMADEVLGLCFSYLNARDLSCLSHTNHFFQEATKKIIPG